MVGTIPKTPRFVLDRSLLIDGNVRAPSGRKERVEGGGEAGARKYTPNGGVGSLELGVLQVEFHEDGVLKGVVVVAVDGSEAEGFVEAAGGAHVLGGVEAHGAVVAGAGLFDQALTEEAAHAPGAVGGADVKAFHLADAGLEGAEGDAADGARGVEGLTFLTVEGQHQAAGGRGVLAGEGGELVLEALEAEGEREAGGVLLEEFTNDGQVGRGVGGEEEHGRVRG
jgi:hypothetical protein